MNGGETKTMMSDNPENRILKASQHPTTMPCPWSPADVRQPNVAIG
jgi:hypothetical protein